MKYFTGIKTVEGLRKRYRELLKKFHPDNENGSVEITQEINSEYDRLFSILSKEKQSDGQSYTNEENEHFKAILNEIIVFNMTIEVIGSWVWCFNSYPYKEQLKALDFTWCSKKRVWVCHDGKYRKHYLLLDEQNELHNRAMHISGTFSQNVNEEIQSAKVDNPKCNNCILEEMTIRKELVKNPSITQKELALKIGKSERTVKTRTVEMQEKGLICRENGKRNGRWKVLVEL